MKTRIIADDLQFPEGPVCLPDGSVLLVEIRRRTLTRVWPDGRKHIVAELGGGPNGAAIGPDGKCYVCNNGGLHFRKRPDGIMVTAGQAGDYTHGRIERVDIETGKVEELYTHVGSQPIRGPNDLVFDRHGGFYFTDLGKSRARDLDHGSVCYAKADGSSVQEIIFPIAKPNGIGLSPDGNTLYVAETDNARVWAWRLKGPGQLADPVTASNQSPHGSRLIHISPVFARFDSLAVEANGNICVGTLHHGGISVCRPEGGLEEFIPIEADTHVTNICFGGDGMRKAYLTGSWTGTLLEADWPRPGLKLAYQNAARI
ncbi:SMP-30/gluconolactonase/LRE family protein [Candidimonas nitroreducens]|uniref:Gluconolaconase n=1 Tax=Candidimonas nitroreducens TaxID=683354 RepID=A0A225MFG5_9BURK|nr:SMP-30/gluconolactonase/LRE family protein [Candidimonas nitroreducens]OWT58983.1 gluconolaconase [Candidimonas nitroreducens]